MSITLSIILVSLLMPGGSPVQIRGAVCPVHPARSASVFNQDKTPVTPERTPDKNINAIPASTTRHAIFFQGRPYDDKVNVYYYRARYYEPVMGRFLQTDPLGYQDSMNLYQGFNMNPINFVDPMGTDTWAREIYYWVQEKVDVAKSFYSSSDSVAIDAIGNTLSDLGSGASGFLNLGTKSGESIGEYEATPNFENGLILATTIWGEAGEAFLTGYGAYRAIAPKAPVGPVPTESYPVESVIQRNAAAGRAREARVQGKLEEHFSDANVQRESYLRTADRKIAKDPLTGKVRRLGHIVVKNGEAEYLIETTSKTASKAKQMAREARIRAANDRLYIRDKITGKLIDITDKPTKVIRVK